MVSVSTEKACVYIYIIYTRVVSSLDTMETFCYYCRDDICRVGKIFKTDILFQNLLRKSVYLADGSIENDVYLNVANFLLLDGDVEWQMFDSLHELQKRICQKYPSKLTVCIEEISKPAEIYPALKEMLRNIFINDKGIGEFDVVYEELRLAGVFMVPYQSIVLESLIVAGKLTAQCINKFKSYGTEIFMKVNYILLTFFEDIDAIDWINHMGLTMHPFGVVGEKD